MNKSLKLDYQERAEKYLEEKQIFDLFQRLMQGLVKEKPGDPLSFMVSKLETPERTPLPHA